MYFIKCFNYMQQHCYLVSYDLCQPGRDYNELYNVLKGYEHWGQLTESFWAIISTKNEVEIRNELMKYIDRSDRLIVMRSSGNAAWVNLITSNVWLKENLIK